MLVRRVAPLRDHALPAFAARALPRLCVVENLRTLERLRERQRGELRAPCFERKRAQVAAVDPQQVERMQLSPIPAQLAVEDQLSGRQLPDRGGDVREVLRQVVARE